MKVPTWIHHHFPRPETLVKMKTMLGDLHLHTVCEEAKCPNIGECFGTRTATFLILGNICTRNCAFCGVKKGTPFPPDSEEPKHIAQAVERLGLSHTVITSVTRDDLPDTGASQFVDTIIEIRRLGQELRSGDQPYPIGRLGQELRSGDQPYPISPTIELLIPYLNLKELEEITALAPEVINHNIETVKTLYPEIRPKYDYYECLELLHRVKVENPSILTKSGFMVGLGETESEVIELMQDLRNQDVDILTIGQYLRPSGKQVPVRSYVHPAQFLEYEKKGYSLGFKYVASGPYVRSSYKAQEALQRCN